ncbi:MAG: hypothetical protein A2231_05940 [Candidatus Firestonebacteria bacterium RIFOXYA2_FULL_40_8]|nr:MAG: hypothetical protein A2231_05940 [Candidatus Firestonebacteria bacterium RIFOXYA2_FULL_40_8]
MSRKIRTLVFSAIILFIIIIIAFYLIDKNQESEFARITYRKTDIKGVERGKNFKNIKKVKAGLKEDEIIKLLGAPDKVVEEKELGVVKLYYPTFMMLPIVIDNESRKLVYMNKQPRGDMGPERNLTIRGEKYLNYRNKEIKMGADKILKFEMLIEEYLENILQNPYVNKLYENIDSIKHMDAKPVLFSVDKGTKIGIDKEYNVDTRTKLYIDSINIHEIKNIKYYVAAYRAPVVEAIPFVYSKITYLAFQVYIEEGGKLAKSIVSLQDDVVSLESSVIKMNNRLLLIVKMGLNIGHGEEKLCIYDLNTSKELLKIDDLFGIALKDLDNDGEPEIISESYGKIPEKINPLYLEIQKTGNILSFPEWYGGYIIYKHDARKNEISKTGEFTDIFLDLFGQDWK